MRRDLISETKIIEAVEKVGTLFDYPTAITPEVNNDDFINGYENGMEDCKRQILQRLGIKKYTNPTFYDTIVASQKWREWVKENEQNPQFDVHESMETGWLSNNHFQAFIEFCKK